MKECCTFFSKINSSMSMGTKHLNQSCVHIKASSMNGVRVLFPSFPHSPYSHEQPLVQLVTVDSDSDGITSDA
jgi:hypothetical protein